MSRILRCFICLLLIGCILVNCSPLKVHAIDPVTFAGISVAGSIVVSSIIQGVGVLPIDSEDGAFGTLVNNCVSALEAATSFVIDGMIHVTGVPNAMGSYTAFVPLSLVQWIWEWIAKSGAVSEQSPFFKDITVTSPNGSTYEVSAVSDFCICVVCTKTDDGYPFYYCLAASYDSSPGFWVNGKSKSAVPSDSANGRVYYVRLFGVSGPSEVPYPYLGISTSTGVNPSFAGLTLPTGNISVPSEGLSLGEFQSPYDGGEYPILLEDAPVYAPWTSGITDIPSQSDSDENIDGIPVTVPDSYDDSLGIGQSGAQAGTNDLPWADSDTGTDSGTSTGTIADVITNIKSLGVSFADSIAEVVAAVKAIPAAIADIFTPSAEIGHFALDLKNFFPFCIPFDLYDFFVCLNADPVAPVIDWEIYLPGGDTYPLKLDLAVFDDVAQLLRTLQLLLFCVGLAAKTRDLIKG